MNKLSPISFCLCSFSTCYDKFVMVSARAGTSVKVHTFLYTAVCMFCQVPYIQQLGSSNGTQFAMASVAGRPYNVGFVFRIISASDSSNLEVLNVIEYNFDRTTFAYIGETQRLTTVPHVLARGSFIEFDAGRGRDEFTVVFVNCSDRCEVRAQYTIYHE